MGMMSKRHSTIAGAAVLSLLLLGLVPVFAQSNEPSQTDKATTIIQVAQAAHSYAEQLVSIAKQHQVNTTKAESLISRGDPLLSKAQSEVSTNATLAIKDAMGAMYYYRGAAEYIQSALAGPSDHRTDRKADQLGYLRKEVQQAEERTNQLQTMLTKVCSAQSSTTSGTSTSITTTTTTTTTSTTTASATTNACSDGQSNLGTTKSDLEQAATLLKSDNANVTSIVSLFKDAQKHMSVVYADISQIANARRAQEAITYIQNYAEKQLAILQQEVAKMNSSATQQQYQQQLTQAQSLLGSAVQAFQSGSFDTGMHDAQQAMQLMQQVAQGIRGAVYAHYIQTEIEPRLAQLQEKAQKANLSSSVSQEVQTQLSQAKSLLDGAIQSFLSGNFKTGGQQVQQAVQLMQQVMQEIASSTHHP
jgi:hypothetical protein